MRTDNEQEENLTIYVFMLVKRLFLLYKKN